MTRWIYVLLLLACCASEGCRSHTRNLRAVRKDFYAGYTATAEERLNELVAKKGHDEDVLLLDQAVVELSTGKPREAEQKLKQVRDRFDHAEQLSLAEESLSSLTDDTVRAYSGEDYEKVMIRSFLALSNLMHGDGGDAGAYTFQVGFKEQEIYRRLAEKDKELKPQDYPSVAMGPYLHGVLREATHRDFDDAARAYRQVAHYEPMFPFANDDIQRAEHGRHSEPGNGVVYIFGLVGRGPYKQEVMAEATTASLLIADVILKSNDKYKLPTSVAPVRIGKVAPSISVIHNLDVSVDGQAVGQTAVLTDVTEIALKQQELVINQVIARAIVRRLVKRAVVEGAKQVVGDQRDNPWAILLDAGEFAWGLAESTDTRCWSLLPDTIQVLRVELPAGTHKLTLQPIFSSAPVGESATVDVTVENGRNTYLLANFPDRKLVGEVLVNTP